MRTTRWSLRWAPPGRTPHPDPVKGSPWDSGNWDDRLFLASRYGDWSSSAIYRWYQATAAKAWSYTIQKWYNSVVTKLVVTKFAFCRTYSPYAIPLRHGYIHHAKTVPWSLPVVGSWIGCACWIPLAKGHVARCDDGRWISRYPQHGTGWAPQVTRCWISHLSIVIPCYTYHNWYLPWVPKSFDPSSWHLEFRFTGDYNSPNTVLSTMTVGSGCGDGSSRQTSKNTGSWSFLGCEQPGLQGIDPRPVGNNWGSVWDSLSAIPWEYRGVTGITGVTSTWHHVGIARNLSYKVARIRKLLLWLYVTEVSSTFLNLHYPWAYPTVCSFCAMF